MTTARKFFQFPGRFEMFRGGQLDRPVIAYETWGRLNAARDNLHCENLYGSVTFARPFRWPIVAPAREAPGFGSPPWESSACQGFCSAYTQS